jgi:antitoxin (DNA-binding transcriptional repressor) of toxin-antitoxin stability system
MTTVASRDLRNRTADVLRQVADGTPVTITVNGAPVADITAHRGGRRASLSRREFVDILDRHQADAGLRVLLNDLVGDNTDDLGPLP